MIEHYLKNYCIIGLGKVDEVKDDLTVISESSINYVSGEGLLIATFTSTFHIGEIEDILKTNERSYIIFEMTPGFFSANIENKEFQESLFGSLKILDSSDTFYKLKESLDEIREKVKNGDIGIEFVVPEPEKTDDELLEEALADEDYEEAAKLRDKINKKK
ncbi:MAG: UvrB/UvrC motif-containing protein [Promethearchaeota archaeon]|jgi:hypothetical protein|tara:strand:- start:1268 stop:1750 length:483 start_codon:yes stop_codon:yes gene_type:complete